jgi:hypothetical protein
MPKVSEDGIDAIRQIAATLIRHCPDIPVRRSVDQGRPWRLLSSMLLRDEEARQDSRPLSEEPGIVFNRWRDSRERASARIVDPGPALALIFENSEVFDSVVNRSALFQVMQQNVMDLAVIETEVDLHILPPYNARCFESRDTSRVFRLAEGAYQRYRAHAVSALAEAIRRYGRRSEAVDYRRTPLGRNIDRLRKECGWSFDDLADKTDLDRRLVLGHVNEGKGALPRTLRRYATAFSDALNRPVTVAELQS